MNIAILGYGEQGRSALEYWGSGNDITVCEENPDVVIPTSSRKQVGQGYLHDLERFDLIIRSPAVHPRDIVAANGERILRKITTVTEEFFRNCPAPIIGVTGTKGKGTTSTLITKLLEAAGKTVHLGGNIGIPPLDLLKENIQPSDFVVLELANFQLIDLRVSPKIAVCLMVAPEHLDWHKDMKEYLVAKQNLFRYQDDNGFAVFNRLNDFSTEVAGVSPALKLSYEVPPIGQEPLEKNGAYVLGETIYYDDTAVCSVADVALLGRHNLENVCAAIAATWEITGANTECIKGVVKTFAGLPHRLEFVKEIGGVRYYDDSFGTTPETAMVAIDAIPQPKVLILGGSDKNASFDELARKVVNSNTHTAIVIGVTGAKIKTALDDAGFTNIVDGGASIESIVELARAKAHPGDAVLLSTACASFDMFKNYKDRGERFTKAVRALDVAAQ